MTTAQSDLLDAYAVVGGDAGLDGFRRYRRRTLPSRQDLDMVVEEISLGRCVFSTTASGLDVRQGPSMHGGLCTTLLDFAMAAAVQSTIGPAESFRVVRFGITFKQDGVPPRGRIEARAHAHSHGPQGVQASGLVVDRWGTIRAQATMFVVTAASQLTA